MLRTHGWPAPEDPPPESVSGDTIGDRLADEAQALRDVTDWLDKLVRTGMPEVINLRPSTDFPFDYRVLASHERIVAILARIASDIDELARARRVEDLTTDTTDRDERVAAPSAIRGTTAGDAPPRFIEQSNGVMPLSGSSPNTATLGSPSPGEVVARGNSPERS